MFKKLFLVYLFVNSILYAEPTNKFSVAGNLNNNGSVIVQQTINSNQSREIEVSVKTNLDYKNLQNSITFENFSKSKARIICNDKEIVLYSEKTKTINIPNELDNYGDFRLMNKNKIYVKFETFDCECANCIFVKSRR